MGEDLSPKDMVELRHFLQLSDRAHATSRNEHALPDNVYLVIVDNLHAEVYTALATDVHPQKIPLSHQHLYGHLHAHSKKIDQGKYHGADPEAFERIVSACKGASEVFVAGHGTGKSNAAAQLIEHIQKTGVKCVPMLHEKNLQSTNEVLAHARQLFAQEHKK